MADSWPPGLKKLDVDHLDLLGIDHNRRLYWDGIPIVTSVFAGLTTLQKCLTLLVGVAALLGGLGSAAQGWVAYRDWACKVGWRAIVCPLSPGR